MSNNTPPSIWNAFVVPAALGIFYCVVLCISYPHLASMFPVHFNAAGTPDQWTPTGPILLASLVSIALIFLVLGISTIYSAEKRLAWWLFGLTFAGLTGAAVGAAIAFIHAVRDFRGFHSFAWILWGLVAVVAESGFLLIPSRGTAHGPDTQHPSN
jgi:hypothetical protein